MELVLSTANVWDATWSTKDGKALYKTSCPARWFHSETITIEKAISADAGELHHLTCVSSILTCLLR
jgi:hypothetical protein